MQRILEKLGRTQLGSITMHYGNNSTIAFKKLSASWSKQTYWRSLPLPPRSYKKWNIRASFTVILRIK